MSKALPKPIFIPLAAIFLAIAILFLMVQIIAGLEQTIETSEITAYAVAIILLVGFIGFHTYADPDRPRIRAVTQILSFVVFMLIVLGNFQQGNNDTTMAIIILIISLFLMRGLQLFARQLRIELAEMPRKSRS